MGIHSCAIGDALLQLWGRTFVTMGIYFIAIGDLLEFVPIKKIGEPYTIKMTTANSLEPAAVITNLWLRNSKKGSVSLDLSMYLLMSKDLTGVNILFRSFLVESCNTMCTFFRFSRCKVTLIFRLCQYPKIVIFEKKSQKRSKLKGIGLTKTKTITKTGHSDGSFRYRFHVM